MYFNFYLYYADRLRSDKSNVIQVQSNALSSLKNIIAGLTDEGLDVGQITYTPFQMKFDAETAGMYASISVGVPLESICEEKYN